MYNLAAPLYALRATPRKEIKAQADTLWRFYVEAAISELRKEIKRKHEWYNESAK